MTHLVNIPRSQAQAQSCPRETITQQTDAPSGGDGARTDVSLDLPYVVAPSGE
jgi:hypothetical protein